MHHLETEEEEEAKRNQSDPFRSLPLPTNNALLINFPTEFRCRNFVDKHQLSIQIGAQACEKRVCKVCIFQPSFHFRIPPLVVGLPLPPPLSQCQTFHWCCDVCWLFSFIFLLLHSYTQYKPGGQEKKSMAFFFFPSKKLRKTQCKNNSKFFLLHCSRAKYGPLISCFSCQETWRGRISSVHPLLQIFN